MIRFRYEIFPISAVEEMAIGLPAWRWMATVTWVRPGEARDEPHFRCFRAMCPIRLAHWVFMVLRRSCEEVPT